jgi:Rps23 Pro-64 3,4-dihydroxylase Tpa1-like proline 4-hydroxylase
VLTAGIFVQGTSGASVRQNKNASVSYDRGTLADLILARLQAERARISTAYEQSAAAIPYFWIDDLLPMDVARAIRAAFPRPETMKLKKSLREYKYIAAQMDQYDATLEEAVFAFQDPRIVMLIGELTGIKSLHPDEHLYAGGISMMGKDQYLNPHVDNSHDKDRERWRVLNLLYYVSEDWTIENGGNLELWPEGLEGDQITIHSRFNRLAVMATHDQSWHSVSPIKADAFRCCVSNYYFSDEPLRQSDQFHVTSFRGRPEQPLTDKLLQADAALRTGIRKVLSNGIGNKDHVYRRPERRNDAG